MVLHAGIYYFIGPVLFFDTETKETIEIEIKRKIWRMHEAEEIFNLIKSQSTKEFGCACICLSHGRTNEERTNLINVALNVGFKKVRIIDGNAAFYLSVISQITYKPNNCDIIWLYTGARWYTWYIGNNKAIFISIINVKYSKNDLNAVLEKIGSEKIPTVILYNDAREFDIKVINEAFPECLIFGYKQGNYLGKQFESMQTYIYPEYCSGALVKARVMGKDPDALKYNVSAILTKKLQVFFKQNKLLLSFNEGEKLPATKSTILEPHENCNILKVDSSSSRINYIYCLQINKNYSLTLTLEKDGIFDIDLKQLENQRMSVKKSKFIFPKIAPIPFQSHKTYIVGVNLGNSRCCAATLRRSGIEVVALDNTGERLLPCYIGFDEKLAKCGNVVVKRLYQQFAREKPVISTVFDIKKIIGKKLEDINLDKNWHFKVVQDASVNAKCFNNKAERFQYELLENNDIFIGLERDGKELYKHPEDILAVLLKHIRQEVDKFQGREHSTIMITVPYSFTDSQKTSITAAAVLAGWEAIDIMPEPVAAAFAHFANERESDVLNFVIFDLGGTTLNTFVATCSNNEIQILSHTERSNLGGKNFNNLLVDYFAAKLKDDFGFDNLNKKIHKLYLECGIIKEHLSEHAEASLDVDDIFVSIEGFIEITRTKFEEISKHLLEDIKACVMDVVEKSGLNVGEISHIIFVGGGSRMPMIQTLLQGIFYNAKKYCGNKPDEAIAAGATHYANYLNSHVNAYNRSNFSGFMNTSVTEVSIKPDTTLLKNYVEEGGKNKSNAKEEILQKVKECNAEVSNIETIIKFGYANDAQGTEIAQKSFPIDEKSAQLNVSEIGEGKNKKNQLKVKSISDVEEML